VTGVRPRPKGWECGRPADELTIVDARQTDKAALTSVACRELKGMLRWESQRKPAPKRR
jgi:hypothetical protein